MSKAQELEEAMAFLQATLDGYRGSQATALEDENPHLAECFQEMHIEPMERAMAAIRAALSASNEQQSAQQDERNDALQDSAYAAGMLSGWNLCVADDHTTFSRIRGERMTGAARVALAARASNGGKA